MAPDVNALERDSFESRIAGLRRARDRSDPTVSLFAIHDGLVATLATTGLVIHPSDR